MSTKTWPAATSLGASALLCFSTSSLAQTALPKEGDIAATAVFVGSYKQLAMGKDLIQTIFEATGGWVADKPDGFGDRVTGRCVGTGRSLKGKVEFESATCEFTDRQGDKFYSLYSFAGSDGDKIAVQQTLSGGTGKYTGITGGWDVVRRPHPSPAEGQNVASTRITGNYKLP
jgi:hypothetical protein